MPAPRHESPLRALCRGFIAMGRAGTDEAPAGFPNAAGVFRLVVQRPGFWEVFAAAYGEEDLRFLIRGMVHYTRHDTGYRLGGSVSPVIWLFHCYAQRFPEREGELAAWVVRQRTNEYEPYGSLHCSDAPSLLAHQVQRSAEAAATSRRVADEQGRAHAERLARDAAHATIHLPNAIRRGDERAVEALLRRGADAGRPAPHGGTLLSWARLHRNERIVELLQHHAGGADAAGSEGDQL